eukprot:TRINITY_DN1910_c0_g1_i1.p1 TRINITY_DN1910_c0_g1~~TRINITY_DN1910_c0_g1_i1.p1  ORF type:complete len:156 (+),score=44.30 TRINITY_DN1910_c0_g1_i1:35-502(+)
MWPWRQPSSRHYRHSVTHRRQHCRQHRHHHCDRRRCRRCRRRSRRRCRDGGGGGRRRRGGDDGDGTGAAGGDGGHKNDGGVVGMLNQRIPDGDRHAGERFLLGLEEKNRSDSHWGGGDDMLTKVVHRSGRVMWLCDQHREEASDSGQLLSLFAYQ